MSRFRNLVVITGALLLSPAVALAQADLQVLVGSKETPNTLTLTVYVMNLGPKEYKKSQGRTVTLSSGKLVLQRGMIVPDLKTGEAYGFPPYVMTNKPASLAVFAKISPGDDNPKNDEFGGTVQTGAGKVADLSALDIKLSDPVDGSVRLTAVVKNVDKLAYQKADRRNALVTVPELRINKSFPLPDLQPNEEYRINVGTFLVNKLPPQLHATLKIDAGDKGGDRDPINDKRSKTLITPTQKADLMVASLTTPDGKKIVGVVKNLGPTGYSARQKRTVTLTAGAASKKFDLPDLEVGNEFPVEILPAANAGPKLLASLSISPGDQNARNDSLRKAITLSSTRYDLIIVARSSDGKTFVSAADVEVKGAGLVKGGKTNFQGAFTVKLLAGNYAVSVQHTGYTSNPRQVTVAKDERVEIVLTKDTPATPKSYDLIIVAKLSDGKTLVPAADVEVKGVGPAKAGKTNVQGAFTVKLLAGNYTVSVRHTGYTSNPRQVTVARDGRVEVVLTKDTPATPKSYDLIIVAKLSDGKTLVPAADVEVKGVGPAKAGKTNVQGAFTVKLLAGNYTVSVRHTGYTSNPRQVTVARDERVEIVLTKEPPKSYDLIIVARSSDGKTLVSAADVEVKGVGPARAGKTNVQGAFTVKLLAGNYTVSVQRTGYTSNPRQVTVARDERVEIVLTKEPPKSYDLIIVARSSDGKTLVSAADVEVKGVGPARAGKTNVQGAFTVKLLAGNYTVSVQRTGYTSNPRQVTVAKDERVEIVLTKDTPATPKSYDLIIVAKLNDGKTLVSAADVEVKGVGPVKAGKTNFQGAYTAKLLAGNYAVSINYKGYTSNPRQVTVPKDGRVDIVLTKEPPATPKNYDLIIVAKLNDGKTLVPAADVQVEGAGLVKGGKTNFQGAFTVKLLAGNYTVSANHKGYTSNPKQVTVPRDGRVEIVLTPTTAPSRVLNRVLDHAGIFKPETINKANETIARIKTRSGKDVVFETFKEIPGNLKKYYNPKQAGDFMGKWVGERMKEENVKGVYILFCREPYWIAVEAGDLAMEKTLFNLTRGRFNNRQFDEGLLEAIAYVEKALGGK